MATKIPMNTLKKVIYKGNELNKFNIDGCSWRKPYILTIPELPVQVASVTVTRQSSESNCGQLENVPYTEPDTENAVLYGDVLAATGTASTGYNAPTFSFTNNSNIVSGDTDLLITPGSGKTYYVSFEYPTFDLGSVKTTLPSTLSRIYPNAATLPTNNCTVTDNNNNTVLTDYVGQITYKNANNQIITSFSENPQKAFQYVTYNANGWTTTNGGSKVYDNGDPIGKNNYNNLTVYPSFTKSITGTNYNTVTTYTNNINKSPTTISGFRVTFTKGQATSGSMTTTYIDSTRTKTYTPNGWTRNIGSTTQVYPSNSTQNLKDVDITVYPCYSETITNNSITLPDNPWVKSNTEVNSYTVTYNKGNASGTSVPATQTSKNITTYTANGWTSSSTSIVKNITSPYTPTAAITLYPAFSTTTYNSGVTTSNTTMSRASESATGCKVTYNQGNADSGTTIDPSYGTKTLVYSHIGWAESINGTKKYDKNVSTGALTQNITLYPAFSSSVSGYGGVTLKSNTFTKSATYANSYTVTYNSGTATGGTLPSNGTSKNKTTYTTNGWATSAGSTTRAYADGATISSLSSDLKLYPCFSLTTVNQGITLGTNSMTKSNTEESSYTITYNQGIASNTANIPSKYTSKNTVTYTANGWTKTSGSTNKDYANNVGTGALSANLTLYPCFSQTRTNQGGTVAENKMTKASGTGIPFKITYNKGNATSSTVPQEQVLNSTRTFTPSGWSKASDGTSKDYSNNEVISSLSSKLVLYPYFTYSDAHAGTTVSSTTMTKNDTTAAGKSVIYNNGTATGGTLPANAQVTDTIKWTHDGWANSTNGAVAYALGGSTGRLTGGLSLYPHFTSSIKTYGSTTLGTNSMTKSNTEENSYTVTYNRGSADSTVTVPSTLTSKNTVKYTANGWTKTSGSTTKDFNNGASSGNISSDLKLYPCFSQTRTNQGVTLSSTALTKSNSSKTVTITYNKGDASSTAVPNANTGTSITTYTQRGWSTSANATNPTWSLGDPTGALSSNITIYPSYLAATVNAEIQLASNIMTKNDTTASSYTVTYNKGTATSGTLPANTTSNNKTTYTPDGWATSSGGSKVYGSGAKCATTDDKTLYPAWKKVTTNIGATLGTNSMTKSSTEEDSYTVTYLKGSADALPTGLNQVSKNTVTYTANGWTKTSGSTNKDFNNGVSTGALTEALTLYPCFSQSRTNQGVTLSSATFYRTNTEGSKSLTYYSGGTTNQSVKVSGSYSYSHTGWRKTTSSTTTKDYNKGASTGVLTDNLELVPYFTSTYNPGTTTLLTNNQSKANTEVNSYTVTYNLNGAAGTTPPTATSKNITVYTPDGWATSSGGAKVYNNGQPISVPNDITLYPAYSSTTTNSGVTTASTTVTIASSEFVDYTVSYNKGVSSQSSGLPSSTQASRTTTYKHTGWATGTSVSSTVYGKGVSTGALTKNITLYPFFTPVLGPTPAVALATNNLAAPSAASYPMLYASMVYNLILNPQGGSINGSSANQTTTLSNTISYTPDGWTNVAPSGTSPSIAKVYDNNYVASFGEDTTLYPAYARQTTPGTYTLPTPTKSGYTFGGWCTDSIMTPTSQRFSGGETITTADLTAAGNTTLYALWVAIISITAPVIIAASPYVSSVWLGTLSTTAESTGKPSGTRFDIGTTVYGFAKLAGYVKEVPSTWTKVSGTANATGAIYRIGSVKLTTSMRPSGYNFGTITIDSNYCKPMVQFTGAGKQGTLTFSYAPQPQLGEGFSVIKSNSTSTTCTFSAKYSSANGTTITTQMVTFNCSSTNYNATYSLKDGTGASLSFNSHTYDFPVIIVINTASSGGSTT